MEVDWQQFSFFAPVSSCPIRYTSWRSVVLKYLLKSLRCAISAEVRFQLPEAVVALRVATVINPPIPEMVPIFGSLTRFGARLLPKVCPIRSRNERRSERSPRFGDTLEHSGKKTAEAIRQEVEREVSGLLRIVFQDLRRTGRLDLEAVEMAMRSAMHQAGAALSRLLRCESPGADQRELFVPAA